MTYARTFSLGLLFIAIFLVATGCRSVPFTGRKQMLLMPESQEIDIGRQAFNEVLSTESLSSDARTTQIVERVGGRIAVVANRPDYQWEFRLLSSTKQNAFCLPGGKVAVYEGIIPVCHNEAGLAVVMSHEIAHAIARHGGERMSTDFQLKTVGGLVGNVFQQQSQMTRDLFMQAYGVGTNLGVVLPHSRKHELEADQIGVMLMARAGYDPNEAPKFWVRFGEVNSGSQPTEWMSTHPSDARRAGDLQAMMPQAMNEYNLAPHKLGLGEAL